MSLFAAPSAPAVPTRSERRPPKRSRACRTPAEPAPLPPKQRRRVVHLHVGDLAGLARLDTPLSKPVVGMTETAGGYYLSTSDGGVFTFPPGGVPPFLGSTGNLALNKPIVGIAG
jgi:hypothetical protein